MNVTAVCLPCLYDIELCMYVGVKKFLGIPVGANQTPTTSHSLPQAVPEVRKSTLYNNNNNNTHNSYTLHTGVYGNAWLPYTPVCSV